MTYTLGRIIFTQLLVFGIGCVPYPDNNLPSTSDGVFIEHTEASQDASMARATNVLTWVFQDSNAVAHTLSHEGWAPMYPLRISDSMNSVWNEGINSFPPLREIPTGLRTLRPGKTLFPLRNRPGASRWSFRDSLQVVGSRGSTTPQYIAPWFTEWRHTLERLHSRLAREFHEAGGLIDNLIFDWEEYNTPYNIRADLQTLGLTPTEYADAVIKDPRWPKLRSDLNTSLAMAGYDTSVVNFDHDLADIEGFWNQGHSPKGWVWTRYMHSEILNVLHESVYEPWAEYFPDLRASDYQKYSSSESPEYAHANWTNESTSGPVVVAPNLRWVVGTHQAPSFYGTRGLGKSLPIQIHLLGEEAGSLYKKNPPPHLAEQYSVLIKSLVKLRGAIISSKEPLMIWVSSDQYPANIWTPAGGAKDYQWYAESIYHFALHNVDTWLFWNTHRAKDGSSERRLVRILDDIESLTGTGIRGMTLEVSAPDWDKDLYLLSGLRSDSIDVYRFTPRETGSITNDYPFTYQPHEQIDPIVPVDKARLVRSELDESSLGFWLVVERDGE